MISGARWKVILYWVSCYMGVDSITKQRNWSLSIAVIYYMHLLPNNAIWHGLYSISYLWECYVYHTLYFGHPQRRTNHVPKKLVACKNWCSIEIHVVCGVDYSYTSKFNDSHDWHIFFKRFLRKSLARFYYLFVNLFASVNCFLTIKYINSNLYIFNL